MFLFGNHEGLTYKHTI